MKSVTVSFAVLLAAAVVFAQQGPFGGGPRMGVVQTDQVKAFLNLSDQQLKDQQTSVKLRPPRGLVSVKELG